MDLDHIRLLPHTGRMASALLLPLLLLAIWTGGHGSPLGNDTERGPLGWSRNCSIYGDTALNLGPALRGYNPFMANQFVEAPAEDPGFMKVIFEKRFGP